MRLPGPFQHCTPCKTEKAHFWIAELTLECGNCGKQTTVAATALKRREVLARLEKGDFTSGVTMIDGKPKVCTNHVPTLMAAGIQYPTIKKINPEPRGEQMTAEQINDKYGEFLPEYVQAPTVSSVESNIPEKINFNLKMEELNKPVVKKGWADGL